VPCLAGGGGAMRPMWLLLVLVALLLGGGVAGLFARRGAVGDPIAAVTTFRHECAAVASVVRSAAPRGGRVAGGPIRHRAAIQFGVVSAMCIRIVGRQFYLNRAAFVACGRSCCM
jgi:hypothetical protein